MCRLSRPFGSAVYAKLGMRYEYTDVKGTSRSIKESTHSNYGNFFPSAFVIWNVNNNNAISLNYAYRIQRPYFEDLNPFVNIMTLIIFIKAIRIYVPVNLTIWN